MEHKPAHGWTKRGQPVHLHTIDHLASGNAIQKFNKSFALIITKAVGSMWCAYAFGLFDLISLPDAIRGGTATIISWVAQTFLQLVLLSVIMVGQNVQAEASDARAAKTFDDTEAILDKLDVNTQGGLKDILDAVHALSLKE